MVFIADRKRAKMIAIRDNVIIDEKEVIDESVPKNVKHGDDTWDAQDKIFRHIEEHLHRHLTYVVSVASKFAVKHHVSLILVGSHNTLFNKIEKHFTYPISKLVKGKFVAATTTSANHILSQALKHIYSIERIESTQ